MRALRSRDRPDRNGHVADGGIDDHRPRLSAADGRRVAVLTADKIDDALREYAGRYGSDFSQASFSPAAAKRLGRPDLVERYYAGREDGSPWPSLNAIKKHSGGSFNTARKRIGLPPNSTGPARGRRKTGEAQPILNVRERLVYVPSEKTKELSTQVSRLRDRVAVLTASRDQLRDQLRDRPVRARSELRVKTRTARVADERAIAKLKLDIERLRKRFGIEQAAKRAMSDQLEAEQRQRIASGRMLTSLQRELIVARSETVATARERDEARDEAAGLVSAIERLRSDIEELRGRLLGNVEAAAVSELVRAAERRAEQAELRYARIEREMAEQASALSGQQRRLTRGEIAALRSSGPAGHAVFVPAVAKVLRSHSAGSKTRLREALIEVQRAAQGWLDRL